MFILALAFVQRFATAFPQNEKKNQTKKSSYKKKYMHLQKVEKFVTFKPIF